MHLLHVKPSQSLSRLDWALMTILPWLDSSGPFDSSSLRHVLACLCSVLCRAYSLSSMLPLLPDTILPDPEGSHYHFSLILLSNTQSITRFCYFFLWIPPDVFLCISRAKVLIQATIIKPLYHTALPIVHVWISLSYCTAHTIRKASRWTDCLTNLARSLPASFLNLISLHASLSILGSNPQTPPCLLLFLSLIFYTRCFLC